MTVREILREVEPFKPMTTTTLYHYIRKFKIKPQSKVRQLPQQYPADTAKRVLKKLGFNGHSLKRAA